MSTKTSPTSKSTNLTASSLRSLLLSGGDAPYDEVTLPIEHEGEAVKVYLRPLAAGSVVDFLSDSAASIDAEGKVNVQDPRKQSDAMMRLVARQVCDKDGTAIFDVTDLESLHQLPVNVFNVLRDRVLALITQGSEAGKEPSAVVVEATPTAASPTA